MAHISRRTVMVAGFTAATTAAIGIHTGTAGAAGARALPTGGSYLQIVAHTDDDLLFLNPDIQPSIQSGRPVRTIVLGADEFNGVDGEQTREQLAANLQEGSRSAWAVLAGKPNSWTRATMAVAGKTVEIDTLNGAPQIQMIYLSLPDAGDDLHTDALTKLWDSTSYSTSTIRPTGSAVPVQTYNQAALNAVLLALLQQFQPTTIRVQDPHPDDLRFGDNPDHWDHVAAAKFAQKAVKAYEGPTGRAFVLLTRYRCYNTQNAPANVPTALLTPKTAGYQAYAAHDPLTGGAFDTNLARNYQRWPVVAPWAAIDSTGVLHAFVVAGDSLVMWKQPNGGAWVGPTKLKSGSFAPGVAVALRGDGKLRVAVLDLDTGSVLTTKQTAPGAGFETIWTNVGNPDGAAPAYGTPALGVNSDGGVEMYVVNAAGKISNAFEQGTGFSTWYEVAGGGGKAMTPPVSVTAPSGKLHVFADGNGKTLHWYQNPGSGTVYQAITTTAESTFGPGVAVESTGKVRIVSREQVDGAVGTLAEKTANGAWATSLTHIGGQGGVGPVSAVTSGGTTPRILAFSRNNGYGISVSRQASNGAFGAWTDLGGYCEVGPAAVRDAMGKVRVLVVGGDAKLYEAIQTTAGPDGAFGSWQQAGN
ncbi:MAG: hypothetical protein ABWY11_21680 [Umezawaea sp.]